MQAYDDFAVRFFQIDPNLVVAKRRSRRMSGEKYYNWTPYHYSANNPVSFLDGGGMIVYKTGNDSLAALIMQLA